MSPLPRTILVVDDDREVQRYLTERFEAEGWRVICEKDGDWALRTFERRPVDAVVLDLLIPVVSGFQVAEQLRALPRGKDVGIVMITGIYRGDRHRAEALARYALLDYLDKPLDGDRIVALLRAHFRTLPAAPPAEEERTPPPEALVDERQRAEKREVERAVREVTHGKYRVEPRRRKATAGPATRAGAAELRGNLARTPFPLVLGTLYRRRATGGLFLLKDKVKKIIYYQDGNPTFVKSNVLDECLGRVLVRERMISEHECSESVRLMRSEKRQQGSVLIEMGVISPHNLRYALEQQLQVKLYDVFRWRQAEFVFQENAPRPADVISLDLSTANLVLEGIRRAYEDDRRETALAPILDRYLVPMTDPEIRFQEIDLGPAERLLLAGIDGTRTLRELLARVPATLGPRGAGTLLLAMTWTGILEARSTPADPAATPLDALRSEEVDVGTDDAALAAFLDARRDGDPHATLGVEPDAALDEIDAAYAGLARGLHRDRFRGRPETTLRLAAQAFACVVRARRALNDPDRRRPAAARAVPGDPTIPDPPDLSVDIDLVTHRDQPTADAAIRALAADRHFRAGEERLRAHDFPSAEVLFGRAVAEQGDVGKYHAYLGWAMFCARGQTDDAAEEALPVLSRAAELAPGLEEPHLFLGLVHKALDRPKLAEAAFERAIQSNPDSAQALRELRSLHGRRSR